MQVHAYDICRAKVDFKDCAQHACTEVGLLSCTFCMVLAQLVYRIKKFYILFVRRNAPTTQIRASSLSDECNILHEAFRFKLKKFAGGAQDCVRRRAILSLENNPNCKVRLRLYY